MAQVHVRSPWNLASIGDLGPGGVNCLGYDLTSPPFLESGLYFRRPYQTPFGRGVELGGGIGHDRGNNDRKLMRIGA